MNIYKETIVPAIPERKEVKLAKIICDFCQKEETYYEFQFPGSIHRIQTTIRPSIPGYHRSYGCDICYECFMKKLVPWANSLGVECKEIEDPILSLGNYRTTEFTPK